MRLGCYEYELLHDSRVYFSAGWRLVTTCFIYLCFWITCSHSTVLVARKWTGMIVQPCMTIMTAAMTTMTAAMTTMTAAMTTMTAAMHDQVL